MPTIEQAVAAWNREHRVGTLVVVTLPGGARVTGRTRSIAFLSEHVPVVCVGGLAHRQPIDRLDVPPDGAEPEEYPFWAD